MSPGVEGGIVISRREFCLLIFAFNFCAWCVCACGERERERVGQMEAEEWIGRKGMREILAILRKREINERDFGNFDSTARLHSPNAFKYHAYEQDE